jgi:hypothetical protein
MIDDANKPASTTIITTTLDGYSEWMQRLLAAVDPGLFYIRFFDMGFFSSVHRIATSSVPSRLLETLQTTMETCEDAADDCFPLGTISNLFEWGHTLQSVAQTYMRTIGHYITIEETFLNHVAFQNGLRIRDLFATHPIFKDTLRDRGVCDHTVRLMHLLWKLRDVANRCDVLILDYCVRQQIQTARERLEVRAQFAE